ncbi:MAG: hypothetical protein F6K28_13205 [Microcoleus sp. SIO2G3]|nr:hypothetical protein [Microcoleus sp. SIO2G3]
MKVKTTHLIWGSIALIALSQGENVRSSLAKGNQIKQQQTEFSDRIRENRTEARQAQRLSKVALDRYRNNCILVVDEVTGKEDYFQPGVSVLDTQLARPLRPGAFICNRLGDTAIVSQAGTITDIARVTTPDLPEFKKLMEARK